MRIPKSISPVRDVTEEEREIFARDGVVKLHGIHPQGWVDFLEAQLADIFDIRLERAMDQRSVTGESTSGIRVDMVSVANGYRTARPGIQLALEGDDTTEIAGRSVVETDASSWHDGMRAHNVDGPLGEIVSQLTTSAQVNFYADQLFMKDPGSLVKTPFHQDLPYFMVGGGDVAVCWVPVDVVTRENGAMSYVRGSHKWGKTFKPSDFITDTGVFPERDGIDHGDLEELGYIDPEGENVVTFDAEPGDVIVHHWATVHGSAGNVSATARRRAASIRYACEGARFLFRKSSPEPFRFTIGLADGDKLEMSPRFPIVWPRPT